MLKGLPGKTVTFLVATGVPNSNERAQPPRVHRVGESGIWLIMGDTVSHSFGLLPVERAEEIRRMLKSLEERKWSEPVNGLRVWATAVRPEGYPNPVIIFAVKNDSDAGIFVPSELHHGFITATVTSRDGQVSRYVLGATAARSKGPFCKRLPPGKIVYLHPDYSFMDLAWRQKVSPGTCSVVVTCTNTQENGETKEGNKAEPVRCTAWKGELKAPPVEFVLPAGKKSGQGG